MIQGGLFDSVLVEIRAAEGGNDAKLLVNELFQIYAKWCKRRDFDAEITYAAEAAGGFSRLEFVATGPYEWCRNPVAASAVVMVLGLGLLMSSTGVLLLFFVGIFLAHAQVVFLEEPLLRQRFGESYEAYLKRVPRWIPRPPRRSAG